ncbi:uncharacterized protein LOC130676223 isoform X2 [Microplitis mediator]|uniref:uncharacterized protein LOC130676223 isoform X2 n=1 Tax=Microplitis mediator TaxID=375433 RepID=UPI0025544783|nr:uncharacterized protein LOC130676223 isoform X2 [Microplitis mediator]
MSSLMASHDLHLMMIELAVDKLFVPKITVFDSAIIKKSVIMFRILDSNWTLLESQYETSESNDSNNQEQKFHSGKSVVFAISEAVLKYTGTLNLNIDIQVFKENPKYIEMDRYFNVGFVKIETENLFCGIIKELNERKEMKNFFTYYHPREPISKSMKKTYIIDGSSMKLNEPASISIYTRLSYFGKSIITEIEAISDREFHVREETCEGQPYRCREVSHEQSEAGWLGVRSFKPSADQRNLICVCDMSIQSGVKAIAESLSTHEHQQQKQKQKQKHQDNSSIEWKEIPYNIILEGIEKKKFIMENRDDENSSTSSAAAAAFAALTKGMRDKQNNNNNNIRMKNTKRMGKLKRSTRQNGNVEKDDGYGRGKGKGKGNGKIKVKKSSGEIEAK